MYTYLAMAHEPEIGPIKLAIEAIKAATEILHPELETEKPAPRAGPLVVVARFYLSMTLILATVASVAALIDWKTSPHEPSCIVTLLRVGVLVMVVAGIGLGVWLLQFLIAKNQLFIFSPTELSTATQQALFLTKEAETMTEAPPVEAPPGG